MKLVGSHIALEYHDLLSGGVTRSTLKKAVVRKSTIWPFFKDSEDSRKLLIFWKDIEEKYRSLIQSVLGNPAEIMSAQLITPYLKCPDADLNVIRAYTDEQGRSLSPEVQLKYTTACSYLNLINCTRAAYTKMGFSTRSEFEAAVIAMIKAHKVELPNHSKSLLRKLKQYREQGAMCMISKKIGNANRVVIDSLQKEWLISAYADHRKPSVEQVYKEYLEQCSDKGWMAANMRSVRRFLADKSTRQIVEVERDPKIWKDKFGYSIHTKKPDAPCALYESDGTKLNLFYRNDKGKVVADLQMYVVVDVASEAMLGYSFGMSEDTALVKNAYRMAIQRTGVLPLQTRYDNGGSHKSAAMSEYISHVSNLHIPAMAYNGQSKYIEGTLGRFQARHLRLFHNFTGMNITTKSDDSRLNTSFLKSNGHLIPDLKGCISQAVEAIEAWNNTVTKRGVSRLEYFSKNQIGRALQEQDRIMLMYDARQEITYRKDGIEMISEGNKLFFEVYRDNMPDLEFHANNVGRKFSIRWNQEDTSHIYLVDPNDGRIVARADRAVEMAGAIHDYTPGMRRELNHRLDFKKQQAQRALDIVHAAKEAQPVELSHSRSFKDELSAAEGNYLAQSVADSAPAPKRQKKQDIMLPDGFEEGKILDDVF